MHLITRSCVLFLWMQTLTFVTSQECTLDQFLSGPLFDTNFDTSNLAASYPGGKQVRVNCNVGFSGFFKLICVEGKWQSRGAKCQPRSCGHPGDAQFADFHLEDGDDFVFGSKVVYNCQKGYQMVSRTSFRRCMAQGWDGVVPVCEAQQCPVIYVDNNVIVNGDTEEATYGNVVRFSCKSSTEVLSGSSEMYCDENGEWVGTTPKCEAIKCSVPVIENGYVPEDTQEYNENEVLHFRCNSGYTRDNRPSMCKKIGSRADWTPTPACEPVTCRLTLPPMKGTTFEPVYRNVFAPGETVRVNCGPKYSISDHQSTSAVTTCQETGEWSLRPICQEVTCIDPHDQLLQSWDVRYNRQTKRLGDTVSYRCRSGYKKSGGVTQATCTRGGWTPKPLCEEIICNKQDVPNAVVVQNDKETYKYNERVRYDCNEGYRGGLTLTCGERGWTGNPQCPEITCDRRPYQNAHPVGNYQHVYKYNDQVKYICINDHEGSFTVTCGATGWTGAQQCTKKQCKKPDIDNAYISGDEKETYSYNEQVQFKCSNDGDRVFNVKCEEGAWTGIENCSACRDLVVDHGFIIDLHNGSLYYTCNEGYKLFTKGWWAEAKCIDGTWSGIQQCIETRKCGETPEIPNGEVTTKQSDYRPRTFVRITCKEGYQAQVDRLTCINGEWDSNGHLPKAICTPIATPCDPPPRVENAIVLASYQKKYLSGSPVTYQCRAKFTLVDGDGTIQCKDGTWETKNIQCTPIKCTVPVIENGYVPEDTQEYNENEVLHFRCNSGYVRDNRPSMCTKIGSRADWTPTPACEPVTCRLPPMEGTTFEPVYRNVFSPGETVRVNCGPKYWISDHQSTSAETTCQEDGEWSLTPSCQEVTCINPQDQLGLLSFGSQRQTRKLGDRANYRCKTGYKKPDGVTHATCTRDGWTPKSLCEDQSRAATMDDLDRSLEHDAADGVDSAPVPATDQ